MVSEGKGRNSELERAWGLGLGGGSFRKCGEGEGVAIGSADLMCLLMCLLGT